MSLSKHTDLVTYVQAYIYVSSLAKGTDTLLFSKMRFSSLKEEERIVTLCERRWGT